MNMIRVYVALWLMNRYQQVLNLNYTKTAINIKTATNHIHTLWFVAVFLAIWGSGLNDACRHIPDNSPLAHSWQR